jgi:hypothetical protein
VWKSIGKPPFNELLEEMIRPIKTQIELREFSKVSDQEVEHTAASPHEEAAQAKLLQLKSIQEQVINDGALAIYPVVDTLMGKLPHCQLLEPTLYREHFFLPIHFAANSDYFFKKDMLIVVLFHLSFHKQVMGVLYSFVPALEDIEKNYDQILNNKLQWGFHYHVNLENSLKSSKTKSVIPEITYKKNWNSQNLTTHFEDWVEFVLRSHWEKYTKNFSSRQVSLP